MSHKVTCDCSYVAEADSQEVVEQVRQHIADNHPT